VAPHHFPWPACLFTVHVGECPPPLSGAQGTLTSLLCLFFFLFSCLFSIQFLVLFSFFPWEGFILSRELCWLAQGVLRAAYLLTWWSPKPGRSWNLVKREPSWFLRLTWCGGAVCGLGVEVLEFCLFLVVFPTRCISSISPKVYFRKDAFCFLPLVAILESLCWHLRGLPLWLVIHFYLVALFY
jgi:hypothetical protein